MFARKPFVVMTILTGFTALGSSAWAVELEEEIRAAISAIHAQENHQKNQEALYVATLLNKSASEKDKALAALSLGVFYADVQPLLATQYFTMAKSLAADDSLTRSWATVHLAKIQLASGAPALVLPQLDAVLVDAKESQLVKLAEELRLEALWQVGNRSQFLTHFAAYEGRYPVSRRLNSLMKAAAIAYEENDAVDAYQDVLEALAFNYPVGEESRWALERLFAHQKDGSYVFPIKFLRHLNRIASADAPLKERLQAIVEHDVVRLSPGVVKTLTNYEKINAYVQLREYKKAVRLAEEVYAGLTDDEAGRTALTGWLARLYVVAGQYEMAATFFDRYFVQGGERALKDKSMIEARAKNLGRLGRHDEAAKQFQRLADKHGTTSVRTQEFWNLFHAGQYQASLDILRQTPELLTNDPFEPQARVYWEAKLLKQLGQAEQARRLFQSVVEADRDSYYGTLVLAQDPALRQSDAGAFMPVATSDTATAPFEAASVYHFMAQDLSALHQTGDVVTEEDNVLLASNLVDPLSLKVASVPRNLGITRSLALEAKRWKASYPLAFNHVVDPMAQLVGIDKYLVLSIMRAESYYNEEATSPVNAKGLMQLMPYTALKIADLLQDDTFKVEDLRDPKINITYGAYYLRQLVDYYGDNYFLAIAAYNAGPQAVDSWLAGCRQCSAEEVVEAIPYRETRRYVKKVIRYYNQYRRLHANQPYLDGLPPLPTQRRLEMAMF